MRLSPLLAIVLAACSGGSETDADPACAIPFVGDPNAEPELELVVREGGDIDPNTGVGSGTMRVLADGDMLPIVKPPQLGKVAFVGMRVNNIDVCQTYIKAYLSDCDGRPVAIDKRPARFRIAEDGWAEPQDADSISNFANPQTCPVPGLSRDVNGNWYELTVALVSQGSAKIGRAHV